MARRGGGPYLTTLRGAERPSAETWRLVRIPRQRGEDSYSIQEHALATYGDVQWPSNIDGRHWVFYVRRADFDRARAARAA